MCHRCRDKYSGYRPYDDRDVERRQRHRSYRSSDLRDKFPHGYLRKDFRSGMNKKDRANMEAIETNQDVRPPTASRCPCDWEPYRLINERHAAMSVSADSPTLPIRP